MGSQRYKKTTKKAEWVGFFNGSSWIFKHWILLCSFVRLRWRRWWPLTPAKGAMRSILTLLRHCVFCKSTHKVHKEQINAYTPLVVPLFLSFVTVRLEPLLPPPPPTHPPPHRPDSPLVYPILWDTPDTQSDDWGEDETLICGNSPRVWPSESCNVNIESIKNYSFNKTYVHWWNSLAEMKRNGCQISDKWNETILCAEAAALTAAPYWSC